LLANNYSDINVSSLEVSVVENIIRRAMQLYYKILKTSSCSIKTFFESFLITINIQAEIQLIFSPFIQKFLK